MGDFNALEGVIAIPISETETFDMWGQVPGRVKAKFEDWMELRARRRPFRFRSEFTGPEYREMQDAVARTVGSGQFRWCGDAFWAAIQSGPGVMALAWMLAEHAWHVRGGMSVEGKPLPQPTIDGVAALMKDEKTREDITSAVKSVLDATPNFLAPPSPGEEAEAMS